MPNGIRPRLLRVFIGLALTLGVGPVFADDSKPAGDDAAPTFGSRTEKSDGSSAMTIGRRLPTPWETRVGTDVSLAAPEGNAVSDNLLRGTAADRSSGAVWGNLTMPGLQPLGFDKTSIDARLNAANDQGRLGATLSRSVPLNQHYSVTLQNSYSVTQTLASGSALPAVPPAAGGTAAGISAASAAAWAADETVRLNIAPSGTTLSAGAGSSTLDSQWHSKLSVEQTLLGPLKLTTSVEDAGTAAPKKSVTAGFKRVW